MSISLVGLVVGAGCASADDSPQTSTSVDSYCAIVRESTTVLATVDFNDRATIEKQLAVVVDSFARLADAAPPEISDDAALRSAALAVYLDGLAEVDFSVLDVDIGRLDLPAADLEAVDARLNAFDVRECGIDDAEGIGGLGELTLTADGGTGREQLIAEYERLGFTVDEAACIGASIEVGAPGTSDAELQAEFLRLLDGCGIALDRLDELGIPR